MIHEELQTDIKLLDELGQKVDKGETKLVKTQDKIKNYLEKTSNKCLFCTILAEIVVFLILVSIV